MTPSPLLPPKRRTRRRFLQTGCGLAMCGAAASVLAPLYALDVEPRWLDVTRPQVRLPGLPRALDGLTIVHLSDFHLGPNVSEDDVRDAAQLAASLKPDLAVLTGDFVYGLARQSEACARALGALRARLGVYAVLGNHDIWTDPATIAANLRALGVRVLRDERLPLDVAGARLWLLGVEDVSAISPALGNTWDTFRKIWGKAAQALAELQEGLSEGEPRLLLVHNPDFTEMLPPGRVDLALCGHTHGGQVRLPLLGAPIIPSFFDQKYVSGLVRGPSTLVYVNRGIGVIEPPVRINCRPEVTLLTLRSGA